MSNNNAELHRATNDLKAAIRDRNVTRAHQALDKMRAIDPVTASQAVEQLIAAGMQRVNQN